MYPIEKSKIKIGTKAKARLRLANRRNQKNLARGNKKGQFIFIDCTVIAMPVNYGRALYTVKLTQPLYDLVDKRTKEYEIAEDSVKVNHLYI